MTGSSVSQDLLGAAVLSLQVRRVGKPIPRGSHLPETVICIGVGGGGGGLGKAPTSSSCETRGRGTQARNYVRKLSAEMNGK